MRGRPIVWPVGYVDAGGGRFGGRCCGTAQPSVRDKSPAQLPRVTNLFLNGFISSLAGELPK